MKGECSKLTYDYQLMQKNYQEAIKRQSKKDNLKAKITQ